MDKYAITYQPYFIPVDIAWYYDEIYHDFNVELNFASLFPKEERTKRIQEDLAFSRKTIIFFAKDYCDALNKFIAEFYTSFDNSLKPMVFDIVKLN